jgi:hypothetical protein
MEDEVFELHRRSLEQVCGTLGVSLEVLLDDAAGGWYVRHVEQGLQQAGPPSDLSLAISNAIEDAADLPAALRQLAQGLGALQLAALRRTDPPS